MTGRVAGGEPFIPAGRELLDEFALLGNDRQRARALADRPMPTGNLRHDAFLGVLAEHLAGAGGVARPAWACEADRFLSRAWFQPGSCG